MILARNDFNFLIKVINKPYIVKKEAKNSNVKSFFIDYFSCKEKIPILSYEFIYPKEWYHKKYKRPRYFKPDLYVKEKCSLLGYKKAMADNKDYAGSGKDKGHMTPNADFNFNRYLQKQTFYFSNITPQEPTFNRYIWKGLEQYIRYLIAKNKKPAIVITGIIGKKGYIGKKHIVVPKYLYKILYIPEIHYIKVFLIENKKYKRKKYGFKYFENKKYGYLITLNYLKNKISETIK